MNLRPRTTGGGTAAYTEVFIAKNVPVATTFDDLAAEGLASAAEDIEFIRSLDGADASRIVELLGDPDEDRVRRAVTIARDRKIVEAGPKLIALVNDKNTPEAIVLPAIGALVAIRAKGAAEALIELAKREPEHVTAILFALGELGGKEAEGYLFTVQSGHPNEAFRKLAREALEELERRGSRE